MTQSDNLPTVLAIGIIAYIGETLGHEFLGHGSVCMLAGGHITALAPMWMQCSVHTMPMVVAGPAVNYLIGALCAAILFIRKRADTLSYFLWLSCSFNLLVACGYLIVGGATTFGDWGVVFAAVQPVWIWRLAIGVSGLAGYLATLRLIAALYQRLACPIGFEQRTLRRRTFWPGIGAAAVACAAEIAGGHPSVGSLGLALGCTAFVGWTLSRIDGFGPTRTSIAAPAFVVSFQPVWLATGVLAAGLFVGIIGRVAFIGS